MGESREAIYGGFHKPDFYENRRKPLSKESKNNLSLKFAPSYLHTRHKKCEEERTLV